MRKRLLVLGIFVALVAMGAMRSQQTAMNEMAPATATYDTTFTSGSGDSIWFGVVAAWVSGEVASGGDIQFKPIIDYRLVALNKEKSAAADVHTYGRRVGLPIHSTELRTIAGGSAFTYDATWSGILVVATSGTPVVHITAGMNP